MYMSDNCWRLAFIASATFCTFGELHIYAGEHASSYFKGYMGRCAFNRTSRPKRPTGFSFMGPGMNWLAVVLGPSLNFWDGEKKNLTVPNCCNLFVLLNV